MGHKFKDIPARTTSNLLIRAKKSNCIALKASQFVPLFLYENVVGTHYIEVDGRSAAAGST